MYNKYIWPLVLEVCRLCLLVKVVESRSDSSCGGRLTASRGVILTPNFPGPFEVPIKCRWVIDASDLLAENGSITVYLTQLYVYKGLTFTEYAYYESESSNLGATRIQEVTESNIFDFRWLKTFRPILVIDFGLDRLEGNHVRVLNGLLNVFGFNITYEMSGGPTNPKSCSVKDCSYSGSCFVAANYSTFSCECFDGFTGADCSNGPLCLDDQQHPVCQNGATCRHVGAEAIRCHCADGFTGNYCEVQAPQRSAKDCTDQGCVLQCPFNGVQNRGCNCRNGTKITTDRSRFECRIKLTNVTSVRMVLLPNQGSLEALLVRQIAKYLRNANISSVEELKILSITPTSEVVFHFFGNTYDGDKIRESFNRLVQRRRLGDISLESTHFTFQQKPALKLQNVRINQLNEREVRLGDQFIVSCVAQGSYNLTFTWYKDGMLVNTSKATREIWVKLLPNDGSDQYTSLLGIDRSTLLDAGQYTCQVIDWGMEQCKSLTIDIRDEPNVRVVPMSATIEKGSSIQLKCLTPNMRSIGIGFGWSKNRALLKLEPGSEVWEDLFPAGSILKITNAQKSAIYTCNVAQRSMAVRVEVVNRTRIPICLRERAWGVRWPDTGPGLEALLDCPENFFGHRIARLCSMKDATTPEWQLPNFSACLYEPLITPYNNFQSLTLGYQNTTGAETVKAYWSLLRSRKTPLYPGEGDRIVALLWEIEQYLNATKELTDLTHSAEPFMRIVNFVVENEHSVLNEQQLTLMQQLTRRNLVYWAEQAHPPQMHLALSAMVADVLPLQIDNSDGVTRTMRIPGPDYMYPKWYKDNVLIRVKRSDLIGKRTDDTASGVSIVYKNLSGLLPNVYVTELDDGTDLEYRINSRIVTVDAILPEKKVAKLSIQGKISVDLLLRHIQNHSGIWNISCGAADFTGSWNLNTCVSNTLQDGTATQCVCPHPGTFAVFLTARAVRVALAKHKKATLVVMVGCGSCLFQCLLTSIILGSYWWKNRTWLNFLKVQCCTGLIGAMGIFSYATYQTLPESTFSLVAISLEAFLLVGMSAPISQAMIIYAELTQVQQSQHLQPTVIAVITGVPVLAVLATELAHKSTGWHHESWWLMTGSGVFNIFITCATIMVLIFILLHIGIVHKAHALVAENILKKETIEMRMRLLRRAAVVLCGIISMETSSVLYVNSSSTIVHYVFATLCALLGFIVIVGYVLNSEIQLVTPLFQKLKWKAKLSDEEISDPVKVCSRSNESSENEVGQSMQLNEPSYLEVRGVAAGSIDTREYGAEPAVPSYKSFGIPLGGRFLPEIRIDGTDNVNLENYSTSPRKYQEVRLEPPEVGGIGNAMTGAGSSGSAIYAFDSNYEGVEHRTLRDFNPYIVQAPSVPLQGVMPGSCSGSATVLCSADVESRLMKIGTMPDVTLAVKPTEIELRPVEVKARDNVSPIPDIANTSERKQPDGEENAPEIIVTDCESTASGMLDRISHDLDYLLNRKHGNES
ncbi:uncharacterized protein [Neodiprion pinetum]|uniref:uncharacterized protein isoform X1 n=1 Tax=Neodiprion pinetum TaxID=441929 RepID=UPI001EE14807|nr:uncharacterized protein LOC124216956 isoform X1 [Neodiprion pinetum]